VGKTLERCGKLRRGSAAVLDVTVLQRYGSTVGAKTLKVVKVS
jgi:hypothetical protein